MESTWTGATIALRLAGVVWLVGALGCTDGGAPAGPADAGEGGAVDGAADPGGGLPCDVAAVIERHCVTCHDDAPRFGAPMPLTSWGAVQAPSVTDPARRVYELMGERIHDPDQPMPPATSSTMDPEEIAVFDGWIAARAPRREGEGCAAPPDGGVAGVGPEHLPCTPEHFFTAHADGSSEPFHVPADGGNVYRCFAFRSPFAAGEQMTAWAPVIDDERVTHHWILFRTTVPQVDGASFDCSEMPAGVEFLTGWAPGGVNAVLPADVGMVTAGPDEYLILQVHYWNVAGYADADDRSGVAVCSTTTPRDNAAGVLWLGSTSISIPPRAADHVVEGNCPPEATMRLPRPVNILASFPHMHNHGKRIVTELLPGGDSAGARSIVDVERWDFNAQPVYWHDPPVVVSPGDGLRTRCVYDNPTDTTVRFGERTEDEMCFDFAVVYPIEALGTARRCMF